MTGERYGDEWHAGRSRLGLGGRALANPDESWRRDTEHHENTLIDTASIPYLLKPHGISAHVATAFGHEMLPAGLRVITGPRDI